MGKKQKNINTIISHFELDKNGFTQSNVDFFNVNLDKDNLAFVDYNRIIKYSADPLCQSMADNFRSFLFNLFNYAAKRDTKSGLKILEGIKECNDTRLGYSKNNSKGVSIGSVMKPMFLQALSFLKTAYINDQISSNTLRYGIDGISYDRISDISVSVETQFLAQYTVDQCKQHNILCESKRRFLVYSVKDKSWHPEVFQLPEYKGKTIIFIPKKLISSKAKAVCTFAQFMSYGFKNYIKYSDDIQHLKRADGKIYYKDYKEYLKKNSISRKRVARGLIESEKDIIFQFEKVRFSDIEDLSTQDLVAITNRE
ncbi:hypothetical protein [Olivibacter domesticus]|uniref:Uncharacterized protein n=1 Tax=Olivibacter domesticus TaxID=407022 RepID=A0A1H7WPJ4_OLID1|nr:hypothetical protein [Olivibacter domesticus]SEM23371.1 hypothetical protein SAMN05661044_04599 [Olivibacter domesticus]